MARRKLRPLIWLLIFIGLLVMQFTPGCMMIVTGDVFDYDREAKEATDTFIP